MISLFIVLDDAMKRREELKVRFIQQAFIAFSGIVS